MDRPVPTTSVRPGPRTKLVDSARYFFAYDGTVLPDGTVVISQSSIDYSGPGGSPVGQVWQHVFVSL
ncbi:MAG: hypothetical protein KatS3mg013_1430 [Actinomycetota bacterium]|nr:MAG: hypothetical protein KatS3mg013_1430 [Actinomycetota bacterium]